MKPKAVNSKPKLDPIQKKKKYQTPQLTQYGSVRQFTQAITGTMGNDLGLGPLNTATTTHCLTASPFIEEHRLLLNDKNCQELYRKAIFATVKPGDIVLDLGTGSGLHAFFACQAGAQKVYALDAEPVIELARITAIMNGFEDRIEFILGASRDIELPEKVDVIITNIGYLGILKNLPDARRRFLKPDGKLIPSMVQNTFVPAEIPKVFEEKIQFWSDSHFGFDFSAFESFATNRPYYRDSSKEKFISAPAALDPIDFTKEVGPSYHWRTELRAQQEGLIHGLVGWYKFTLAEGLYLTTEPPLSLAPELWTQPFLPLSKPLSVRAGDKIILTLSMHTNGTYDDPIWGWKIEANGELREHTSFQGMPLSKEYLEQLAQ